MYLDAKKAYELAEGVASDAKAELDAATNDAGEKKKAAEKDVIRLKGEIAILASEQEGLTGKIYDEEPDLERLKRELDGLRAQIAGKEQELNANNARWTLELGVASKTKDAAVVSRTLCSPLVYARPAHAAHARCTFT